MTVVKREAAPVLRAVPSILRSDATVTEFLQPIRRLLDDVGCRIGGGLEGAVVGGHGSRLEPGRRRTLSVR